MIDKKLEDEIRQTVSSFESAKVNLSRERSILVDLFLKIKNEKLYLWLDYDNFTDFIHNYFPTGLRYFYKLLHKAERYF